MARRGQGDHGRRLSDAERAELERRVAAGETQEDVARAVGCDVRTVFRWVLRNGGLRSYERRRSALRLSLCERATTVVGLGDHPVRRVKHGEARRWEAPDRRFGANGQVNRTIP